MHLARPLVLLAAAFALGILLGVWVAPATALVFGITLAALLAAALAWRRSLPAAGTALLLAAAVGAGALRWSWSDAVTRGTVGAWLGKSTVLEGTVLETSAGPDWRIYDVAVAAVVERAGPVAATGLVRVSQSGTEGPLLLPGQRGRFAGKLTPLGRRGADPTATARLSGRGIHFRLSVARPAVLLGTESPVRLLAARSRYRLTQGIAAVLPPQYAALLSGLLLSEGDDLPEVLRDDFRRTGLTHILAVDGAKVGAVLAAVCWLLARLRWGRRRAALAAVPVLVAYCLLVGATAAAMRATVMALAVQAALVLHRRSDTPSALALAALVLLVADPHQILQLGFQLSFAATLGILAFYPLLEHRLRRWPRWLVEPLAVTVAVELAVEPLGLYAFGGLPLISPLVHLWAMPVLLVLVPMGGLTALAGTLAPAAGVLLAVPTGWLLRLLAGGAHLCALLPVAYWQPGRLPAWGAVVWYAVLASLAWTWRRRRRAESGASFRRSGSARSAGSGGAPAGG